MPSAQASTERAHLRGRAALANDAHQSETQEAIPGLPHEVVVMHILRSENLGDPIDLARLRAVSRGMRDAVTATGRKIEQLSQREAARRGCIRTLMHLERRGRLYVEVLCQTAAGFGQLETLQWARANDCLWESSTCTNAAKNGHLEMLQWAHANGCPFDEWTCAYAASERHLKVLQWARANDCPWDKWTCAAAAEGGHLEVLQWLRANGCPWDVSTCVTARYYGIPRTTKLGDRERLPSLKISLPFSLVQCVQNVKT